MIASRRRRKVLRIAVAAVLIAVAVVVLWTWVFPWADRTFINKPGVGMVVRAVSPSA